MGKYIPEIAKLSFDQNRIVSINQHPHVMVDHVSVIMNVRDSATLFANLGNTYYKGKTRLPHYSLTIMYSYQAIKHPVFEQFRQEVKDRYEATALLKHPIKIKLSDLHHACVPLFNTDGQVNWTKALVVDHPKIQEIQDYIVQHYGGQWAFGEYIPFILRRHERLKLEEEESFLPEEVEVEFDTLRLMIFFEKIE